MLLRTMKRDLLNFRFVTLDSEKIDNDFVKS